MNLSERFPILTVITLKISGLLEMDFYIYRPIKMQPTRKSNVLKSDAVSEKLAGLVKMVKKHTLLHHA